NFVLTLADHAQNGFFDRDEWIGVIASAVAVGVLFAVLVIWDNRPLLGLALAVLVVQVIVGVLGAFYHLRAHLGAPATSHWDQFLYGAPIFAPLLFADLAALAAIGLWALDRARGTPPTTEEGPH